MILGIGTYGLAWSLGVPGFTSEKIISPDQLLELVHRHQVNLLQVADNLPIIEWDFLRQQRFIDSAKSLDIRLEIGARGLFPGEVFRYIELCNQAGTDFLRIVIDRGNFEPDLNEIKKLLEQILPELEANNIKLAIENHDRFQVKELVEIIQSAGSELVGICLDTVNSFGKGEGLKEVIDALAPYTLNLHIKDFIIRRHVHNMGFSVTGTPAGQGMLPILELVKLLKIMGRCRSAILELWPEPESTVEKTIEKEQRWIEESLLYLRNIFT
jgi:sugar phosphate isomerase/epimerase